MTTETIATFDIPAARNELRELENELANLQESLKTAVANSDMTEVMRLMGIIPQKQTEVEKLAKKIARESGEDVITKKVTIATNLKLFVVENLTRNVAFQALVNEMRAANPKVKQIVIDLTDSATEPAAINIVGGFRQTKKAAGTTKRPRAAWRNDSFGTNEDGTPKTMTTQEVVIAYGVKYWADTFGDKPVVGYKQLESKEVQKLLTAIRAGENLVNVNAA